MNRALVLGGSFSGLVTAKALIPFFDEVVIIEKDSLAEQDEPQYRSHIPQSYHQHLMLSKGREVVEKLFPGFDQALANFGAPLIDYGLESQLYLPHGRVPSFTSHIKVRSARRPLIDWILLEQLRNFSKVQIFDQSKVASLIWDESRKKVMGITFERKGLPQKLMGELVIDGLGRASPLQKWVEENGYPTPPKTEVIPYMGYASRLFQKIKDPSINWKLIEVASDPPHNPRSAGLWEVEKDQWLLTLIGIGRCYPPRDEEGFMQYARSLPHPVIYEIIKEAKPISEIRTYQGSKNCWHHFEMAQSLPKGIISLGDSLCSFNPIYGQGMTIAALEAYTLYQLFLEERFSERLFYQKVSPFIKDAWTLAVSEDYRWPSTTGDPLSWYHKVSLWYFDQLMSKATSYPVVAETFLQVMNLERSSWHFIHPRLLSVFLR